jgi:hypothetical protein
MRLIPVTSKKAYMRISRSLIIRMACRVVSGNSRGKLSSLHTERTYTVEQSALVGKDVVKKFYNVHKDLERIEEI